MTTIESPIARQIFDTVEGRIGSKRVVYGGSVPNLSTELPHSYHRSWQDSPHDDGYSVHFSGDKSFNVRHKLNQYSCAVDITFHNTEDIQKATARLHHWATTTRLNWGFGHSPYLREFAGTLDGQTVYAMDLSSYRKPFRTFGWDNSHLWHIHLSINRCHILNGNLPKLIVNAFGDW